MNVFFSFWENQYFAFEFFYCGAFLTAALNSTKSSGKSRFFIAYQKFIQRDLSWFMVISKKSSTTRTKKLLRLNVSAVPECQIALSNYFHCLNFSEIKAGFLVVSVSNLKKNLYLLCIKLFQFLFPITFFCSFCHKTTTRKHFLETNFNFLPRKPHKIGSYSLQYAHVYRTCVPYLVILKTAVEFFCKTKGIWLHHVFRVSSIDEFYKN